MNFDVDMPMLLSVKQRDSHPFHRKISKLSKEIQVENERFKQHFVDFYYQEEEMKYLEMDIKAYTEMVEAENDAMAMFAHYG